MTASADPPLPCSAVVLEADDPALEALRADPHVVFVDNADSQKAALGQLRPPPDDLADEPVRWAHYPWRRTVVSVLGPRGFRRVRLDRNRNLITTAELDRLAELTIGVVGLSVGHTIAYTLAAQGLCGRLRLADFDELDLTNLNRVPASILDIGTNKAVVCARRIAELDPYLPVSVVQGGITDHNIDEFVDGLDIVIEECDSLDTKVLVREVARRRRVPVLMTTSDRGLFDVERFDAEPTRPLLHGLIGDVDAAQLRGLSGTDKVPHSLRLVDARQVSSRMAASLIEVGQTLSTWPQLTSEVALNAAVVAEAVRRIGLGETLPSGRARIDITDVIDRLDSPAPARPVPVVPDGEQPQPPIGDPYEAIVDAAARAPSGGNSQPWRIDAREGLIRIALATDYRTTMDIGFRGSAVAVGASAFNARVAAAAHRLTGRLEFTEGGEEQPLVATLRLTDGADPQLAALYEPMLRRETNRRPGIPHPIPADIVARLAAAAEAEGATLRMLSGPDELEAVARVLAAADRIRYLTPQMHAEMFSELRWPDSPSPETGIDIRSLGLAPADLVLLDILARPEVMAHLRIWGGGAALGEDVHQRVIGSSGLAVISVQGHQLTDYARAGVAAESVWIRAEQSGLAVQPISPPFLYAADHDELRDASPRFADDLGALRSEFGRLTGVRAAESQALVLRLAHAPRASVPSRRRARTRSADRVMEK